MNMLLLFLILAAASTAAPARPAPPADCWVITRVTTGDGAIGSTSGGVNTLGGSIAGRTSRVVYLINPATGKGATFRIFVGGKVSTKMTWAQFVATEQAR